MRRADLTYALAAAGIDDSQYALVDVNGSAAEVPDDTPYLQRRSDDRWFVRLGGGDVEVVEFANEFDACAALHGHLRETHAIELDAELDQDGAAQRARIWLGVSNIAPEDRGIELVGGPLERDWCFAFFCQSTEYLRTGDITKALVGVGPIVVPKDGSDVVVLGTHRDASELLDEYEDRHGIPRSAERDLGQ